MTLYAAVRGTQLYVATWFAGAANGNDHFILVSDQLLPGASTPLLQGWSKNGTVAVPTTAAVLCMESTNGWAGWQRHNSSGGALGHGTVSTNVSGQLEGVIDLVAVFGSVPEVLYLSAIAVQTANGGALVAQAPPAVGTINVNLEPGEFLAVRTESLRDSVGDGQLDAVVPSRKFVAVLESEESGAIRLRWPAVPGRRYRVVYKNDLQSPQWETNLPGAEQLAPTSGAASELQFIDVLPNLPQRFYRVELLP
jgi:hypothetical protein